LMKLLIERPANAFDNFELISADTKLNPLNPDPEKGRPLPPSGAELAQMQAWTAKCASLLKVPDEPPEDSGVKYPDILDDANLLEWAGFSLGKSELYRFYLSIKKLAESLPGDVTALRFFGKIHTRGASYFIVEGLSPEDEEGINESLQEGRNGVNKYAYWVTQSTEASQPWVKLPNVTGAQITISRQFKRFLTGNLEAAVPSYPPFPGVEKNLLRAIIARIVGATSISPDGYFLVDDEADPPGVKPNENEAINETFPKAAADLNDPEAWKHHEIDLNKLGRVLKLPEQTDESGEPIVEEDPVEPNPPLNSLTPELWTFRVAPGGSGAATGSCAVAKSLSWPGAVAVAGGRKWVNVYCGWGIPYEASRYNPPLPGPIQTEWSPADEGAALVEQQDKRVDPTPPVVEGAGEE